MESFDELKGDAGAFKIGDDIPGPHLENHVQRLAQRGESGYTGYDEEFLVLDQRSDNNFFGDFQEALKHANRVKNRYSNVLPLDKTRVILKSNEEPGSDYINANYVDGAYEKQYIAAQGPLKETCEAFWRMVYEQQCNVIVMLTKVLEGPPDNQKVKCYQYWPSKNTAKTFGQISVLLKSKEKEHGLVTRCIEMTVDGVTREIVHYQYKEWPDHGLPSSATTFRHLMHLVDRAHDRKGPILVHCSAGIGRTGTFCTVHKITQNLDKHLSDPQTKDKPPLFNVFETILQLRNDRVGMVQTKEQFEFCHKAILEEYQGRTKGIKQGPN